MVTRRLGWEPRRQSASKAQQAVRSLRPHQVMRPFRMHGRESKSLAWLQRFLTVNDRVNEYTDLGMQSGTFKILNLNFNENVNIDGS